MSVPKIEMVQNRTSNPTHTAIVYESHCPGQIWKLGGGLTMLYMITLHTDTVPTTITTTTNNFRCSDVFLRSRVFFFFVIPVEAVSSRKEQFVIIGERFYTGYIYIHPSHDQN